MAGVACRSDGVVAVPEDVLANVETEARHVAHARKRPALRQGLSRTLMPAVLAAVTTGWAGAACGQTYTPFPSPPVIDSSGGAGGNGQNKSGQGTNGAPGGGGNTINRELSVAAGGAGSAATVSATSNGGKGGNGGAGIGQVSGIIGADGGEGGRGGNGGMVNVRLNGAATVNSTSTGGALRITESGSFK